MIEDLFSGLMHPDGIEVSQLAGYYDQVGRET